MLLATILGSGLAGVDATVVNIALPSIGDDLGVGFDTLQWTVTAYTLTLASLILLGGALGDRYGRRRVFVVGAVWFAAASLLCGARAVGRLLVAARALQGVGAALLTPGSLAMIQASFAPQDRSRAIGAWSGLGGVATAIGPFLGGWLHRRRVLALGVLHQPPAGASWSCGSRSGTCRRRGTRRRTGRIDLLGAALAVLGLGGVTYAIIELPEQGAGSPAVVTAAVVGVVAMVAFVVAEARERHPMLPLSLFRSRQFSAANAVTFVVYGAFGGVFFLLAVQLQVVGRLLPARRRRRAAARHRRDAAAVRARRPARRSGSVRGCR